MPTHTASLSLRSLNIVLYVLYLTAQFFNNAMNHCSSNIVEHFFSKDSFFCRWYLFELCLITERALRNWSFTNLYRKKSGGDRLGDLSGLDWEIWFKWKHLDHISQSRNLEKNLPKENESHELFEEGPVFVEEYISWKWFSLGSGISFCHLKVIVPSNSSV